MKYRWEIGIIIEMINSQALHSAILRLTDLFTINNAQSIITNTPQRFLSPCSGFELGHIEAMVRIENNEVAWSMYWCVLFSHSTNNLVL